MSVALAEGPLIALGDEDRPCELVGGKGERWFAWGYHWTILGVRERAGVKEVLVARDKSSTVPGTKRSGSWLAAWRLQKYGQRSETA